VRVAPQQQQQQQQQQQLLHPNNSPFSRKTCVSWYQKAKTGLDLNEARDGGVV